MADQKSTSKRLRANTNRWRAAHPEAWRQSQERSAAKRKLNIAKERERCRRYREANLEARRVACRLWRKAHPDRHRAAGLQWRANNPAKLRIQIRKASLTRKARARSLFVEAVDPAVVFARDHGLCGICREPVLEQERWHIDHIVPLSKGGVHAYANVQLAHGRCNLRKYTKVA